MTVPQAPEDTIRDARDTIDRLSNDNETLREESRRTISALRQDNDRLVRDNELKARQLHEAREHIVKIRQGIIDEAEERDWCDEVNDFLRGVGLDPWETTFTVTFPETTIKITASCAEQKDRAEIIDQAREMITDDWLTHVGEPSVVES